ncbi:MAG: PepSY domain-containing protein, partial [Rhodospirillales bacterium]|nr:PepSY domain-containing protein [Rhodospirillales bacterium]
MSLRGALVRLHRWAGLAMAAFLTLAGLTGAVIAFQGELDAWLNPSLYRARDPGPALSPDALVARLAQQEPRAELTYLSFRVPPGMSVPAFVRPRAGTTPDLGFDQVFLDPASGTILGTRRWGACCFAADRVVPFLYRFHYTLAAGNTGEIFMGVVAILWALDCFVGLSLTFPRGRPFLLKWRTAWTIKHPAAAQRRVLDLHRAGALWLWLLLLLMGVSGVALALPDQVFRPLLGALTPLTPSPYAQAATRPHPAPDRPRIGFDRAIELAAAVARARGWA